MLHLSTAVVSRRRLACAFAVLLFGGATCAPVARSSGASAVSTAKTAPAAVKTFYGTTFEKRPNVTALTELGRKLFSDATLSASGRQSCASCHVPGKRYGPPDERPVQVGGTQMSMSGLRAVPTLTYHQTTPPFNEHFNDTDGDDSADQGPVGGWTWDGRAASAHEQAALPLLSPFEMANADPAAAIMRLAQSPYANTFRDAFGEHVLDNVSLAWNGLLLALEVFQQSPADFYPYTSKYDAFLRGQVTLGRSEQRGLALFNDPDKGNCASCHPSAIKRGAFPQFTDNGFVALAVPRNQAIVANGRREYFDLGLCGPLRADLTQKREYCGMFKTPTLRNAALRRAFFHNGAFHTLRDAVTFYVQRDIRPTKYYPRGENGRVTKYNDIPEAYRANVNKDAPFRGNKGRAALSEDEIRDVVAFLETLIDGYGVPQQRRQAD